LAKKRKVEKVNIIINKVALSGRLRDMISQNQININMKKVIKHKKGGISGDKVLVGVAALGAAGAGAYYLLGPKAKAHQKKVSALFTKIKKEVEVEVKKAKEVGTPIYHKTVDIVSENYAKEYAAHEKEIKAFAKKLKGEWKGAAKKPVKKPAKVSLGHSRTSGAKKKKAK
jgi:hypothetical protein